MRDVSERAQAEQALQQANERLQGWIIELEERNRQATLLNQMGDLLQSCLSLEQAYQAVAGMVPQIFPGQVGVLYVPDSSQRQLRTAAWWGEQPDGDPGPLLSDCLALSWRRPYVAQGLASGSRCRHSPPGPGEDLRLPLLAAEEALGVLNLRFSVPGLDAPSLESDPAVGRRQLAVSMAEHISLALANLRLRQSLREQAIRDPLTGLFNRRYLEETLAREIHQAARSGSPLGVVMLDLDHFKRFNDRFGHEIGDALLQALGCYLHDHVRGATSPAATVGKSSC